MASLQFEKMANIKLTLVTYTGAAPRSPLFWEGISKPYGGIPPTWWAMEKR